MYSVQQLIFDCMGYLKQYAAEDAVWFVAATERTNPEIEQLKHAVFDIWLHRPALSITAANSVITRLRTRFHVEALEAGQMGNYVLLGRKPNISERRDA